MIDIKTGDFLIDTEHKITPQISLATIEKWKLGTFQKTQQMSNNWSLVDVKNIKIDKLYFNISFLFNNGKLDSFTFTFQEKPYDMNPSWDSWSKKVEEENLVRFNNWLDDQFGKERKLEWGKIEAFYDSKSAGSSIKLKYI